MPDVDVVICGAGVGGLTLAHVLRRQGRRVLLAERRRWLRPVHKGELLQPRSLRTLEELGLLAALREAGAHRVDRLHCVSARGEELAALDYRLLPSPYDHGLLHDHGTLRRILADRLDPGVEFRQGTRVTGLRTGPGGRIGGVHTTTGRRDHPVAAPLVVACDGQGSGLRAAARIPAARRRYPHDLVSFDIGGLGDIGAPGGLGHDVTAYLTDQGLRVLFPLPGRRARLYAQIPRGGLRAIGRAGLPEWVRWLLRTVPELAPLREPLLMSLGDVRVLGSWRFVADAWTRPGFALLGDAAHHVHPMAGQGVNAAIADAWELGRRVEGTDLRDPAALDRALAGYEDARARQMECVARMSHHLAVLLTGTSWPLRAVRRHMLRRNRDNVRLRALLTANMAGLTARPLTPRDWLHASGLVLDPHRATSVTSL